MYQLDWSPFHRQQGSKVFRYDRFQDQIQFHEQGRFDDGFYATRLENPSNNIDFSTEEQVRFDLKRRTNERTFCVFQIDLYGDQNSILFDRHQISLNTESFYMSNRSLVQFDRLSSFEFESTRSTRVHLNRIHSEHVSVKNVDHDFDRFVFILLDSSEKFTFDGE